MIPVNLFRRYEGLFPGRQHPGLLADNPPGALGEVGLRAGPHRRGRADRGPGLPGRQSDALRPGMTELELSAECEAAMREAGNSNVRMRAFNEEWPFGNVGAGPDAGLAGYTGNPLAGAGVSPAVGQGSGWRPIGPGEPVVVDLVAFAGGYLCDQTRIISIGPLPADLAEGYRLCLGVQDVIKASGASGRRLRRRLQAGERVDDGAAGELPGLTPTSWARPTTRRRTWATGWGWNSTNSRCWPGGSRRCSSSDQVIACEPKLVFPGRGVVGVENTWRVTDHGLERLTVSPDALLEL